MRKIIFIFLNVILLIGCSTEIIPTVTIELVVEDIIYDQVVDDGRIYKSENFFNAGFKEYKEYNVSKLTGATEAWYGFWGLDEDSVKYYELRFYPDHETAISDGTLFAEDDTGDDAKMDRKETMWRVGLSDRKRASSLALDGEKPSSTVFRRIAKYGEYVIYDNVIILCEGEDSQEAFKLCDNLIEIVNK